MQDRVGLSLSEILAIPQGEVTVAVIAPDEGQASLVLLIDVGDRAVDARRLLDKAAEAFELAGAVRSEETVLGTKLVLYDRVGRRRRPLGFFLKENTVAVSSSPDVLKRVLAVWNGQEASTLADSATFNAVMRQCRGARGEEPQAVWYVNPMLLIECIARNNPSARMATAMLPALGLDGVEGVGGSMALDVGSFDSVAHTHLLLDSARRGLLQVLAFDSGDTDPETWVPDDVASYTTVHLDFDKIYPAIENVYDGFRGEGGLAAFIQRRLQLPPGIDFEQDVISALDGRVTYIVRVGRPVTPTSQGSLIALKLSDAKSLGKVLDKLIAENGPFLNRRSVAGREYFQYAPPQLGDTPQPTNRLRPCFGLLENYLMISGRADIYEEVIRAAADPSKSLANAPDFKRVADQLRQRAGKEPAMLRFERPEEGMRMVYEIAVAKKPRNELRQIGQGNLFLRTLNTALEARPLPPFSVLQRYLAPQGAVLVDGPSGIHYMGFSLRGGAE